MLNIHIIAEGPSNEAYGFTLVPDEVTRTEADLGALGGRRLATASVNGNVMTTKLHKPSNDKVDVVAIRTIRSNNPNVMEYKLIDTESGTELVQHMNRQS